MVNIIKQEVVIEESLKKKLELNKTIKGSNDITKDVKELYLELFDEAIVEYNNKQTRDDRKIDNYFNKISNDTKHDLACEIVIELGDMVYWDDKSLEYKYEMTQIFEKQIDDLKEKTDYLINQLNKVFQKLPEFIKTIVDHLFNHSGFDLKYFKQQYDPEVKIKGQSIFKEFNLFNKREIGKATKHINYEMEESPKDFYTDKEDKEKDDGFEL